jgi:regulatory protein
MNSDIRQAILNMLARRDYSQQEITRKLLDKKYSPEDIQPVIDHFIRKGLIKDSRFAESYSHSRRHKGIGPQRIKIELQIRGISAEIIAEALDITDNEWLSQAQQVWQKRFKGNAAQNYADFGKQVRFLQQRGFTKEQIDGVLGRDREYE